MAILRNDTTVRSADGQSTSAIITAANIGNYGISTTSTYYIGTTQNVFNRASGAQTLTGVSIDGNAATVTNGVYTNTTQTISGEKTFTSSIWGGLPLAPNLVHNAYMSKVTGGVPDGYSTLGSITISAVHPFTKAFEGPYTATAPGGSVNDPELATQSTPYWFGVYNKGPRIQRGGMADGWHSYTDGNILKVLATGLTASSHCAIYLPKDLNNLGATWLFSCFVKIVKGTYFTVGSDAGYSGGNTGYNVSKATADAGPQGWVRFTTLLGTSQITSIDGLAISMAVLPDATGAIEAYIALPYLANVAYKGTNLDSWTGSIIDNLMRNGLYLNPSTQNLTLAGTFTSNTDSRAPIFYDSNDTSYYLDAANTGTALAIAGNAGVGTASPTLSSGKGIHINSSSGHANLKLQSSGRTWELLSTTGAYFSVYDTTGGADRLAVTSAGNVGVATTSADTNLQVVGHVHVGNQTSFDNTGGWNKTIYLDGTIHARMRIIGSAYASGKNSQTETNIWVDNSVAPYSGLSTNAGSFTISAGFTTLTNSARSPIFYDSDNTAFYVDPASTSNLNGLTVAGGNATIYRDLIVNGGTSGNFGNRIIVQGTATTYTLQDTNLRPTIYLTGAYPVVTLNHTVTNNTNHGPTIQFAFNGLTTGGTTSRQILIGASGDGNRLDFGFSGGASGTNSDYNPHNGIAGYSGITIMRLFNNGVLLGNTGAYPNQITSTSYSLDVRGTGYSDTDFRAPIFYDSDNTAYYINGASGSKLKYLQIDGDWGSSPFGSGHESFTIRSTYASMCQRQTNGSLGYWLHHVASDAVYYLYGGRGATDGSTWDWSYRAYPNQDGSYVEFRTSARAPIFYDSNNTSYYVDPASTSNLNVLVVAANARVGGAGSRSSYGLTVGFTDNTAFAANTDVGDTVRTLSVVNESSTTNAMSVLGFRVNPNGGTANAMMDMKFVQTGVTNTSALYYTFNHGGTFADRLTIQSSGNIGVSTSDFSYTSNDNSRLVGSNTNNRLFVNGSIQLLNNNDAIVIGRSTATFLSDEELGFGWGGGWYMTDGTYLRVRNDKVLYSAGEIWGSIFKDSNDTTYYLDPANTTTSLKTRSSIIINNASAPQNLAMLNIGYNGAGETRAIDIYGSWSGGENKSITFNHASASTNIVAQINAQHNGPGSRLRWGKLYHSGDSSTYTMELISESTTSAYLTVAGSVRAPIFYDSNDTGYYIDAASTSQLNQVASYYLRGIANVGTDHQFGLYFSNSIDTAYAIYREGGAWTYPYPDLRIAFHTGIKLGANAGYNGIRFYNDYDMATQVMSVNNSGDGLGSNNVYVNNSLQAGSSLRAPIFYDSNDTTYYVDPASTSRLVALWVRGSSETTGNIYVGGTAAGDRLNINYDQIWTPNGNLHLQYSGGGNIDMNYGGGVTFSRTSLRAPIFYDYNDTAYYCDPNGNSVLNGLYANAYYNLVNDFKDIYVYGDVNTYYVVLIQGEYIYSYGRYSVTRGYNWTGPDTWYVATHKGGLTLDWEYSGDTAWGGNDKAIRIIEFNETYSNMVAGMGYPVNGGVIIWLRGGGVNGALYRIRTPIGANSTVTVYDGVTATNHSSSTTFTAADSTVFSTRANTSNVSAEINARYPVRGAASLYNEGSAVLDQSGTSQTKSGILSSSASLRAPIFYDTDNTGYYIDPNGASSINTITSAQYYTTGWFRNNSSGNGLYNESTGEHFYSDAGDMWNIASGNTTQGLRLRTGGHNGTIRGYFYADSSNNVGLLNNGGNWRVRVVEGDYLLADGSSIRGQLFYDSNDTTYYIDPAGTSNLNKFSAFTMSYNDMNSMHVNSPYVARYNGSALYRNGTMGYGTTDCNVMFSNWGSGFIDSWSNPANAPGGSTHYVGLQGFHYNHQDNSQAYGFQMLCAGEANNRFFWRSAWPTLRSWVEMIHSGNYNSFAPTLTGTGASGSWGISVTGSSASCTGNAATATTATNAGCVTSDTGNVGDSRLQYWQLAEGTASLNPTTDWYNAIRMGHGNPVTYYSNTLAVKMTGSNLGDIYTRTTTNGTAGTWNRFWNNNNDGAGSGLDADLLDGINSASFLRSDVSATNSVDLRSPVFYDSSDTAYFLDLNSSGSLIRGRVNITGGHNNSSLRVSLAASENGASTGIATLQQWCSEPGNTWEGAGFGYNVDNNLNEAGNVPAYYFGRPNTSFGQAYMRMTSDGNWYFYNTPNGSNTRYTTMVLERTGYVIASNSIRSPIFHDSDNTAYYVDPASTSNLVGLTVANTITGSVSGSSGSCTGNAANVTGTVAIANGGTGATTNANARTNLGATTIGSNLFTLTNPSAITFLRVNADNTVSALNASDFRNAIGAGGGGVTVETSTTQSLSGTTGCTIDVAAANVHILSLANATTISSFTYNNRNNNPSVNTLMIVLKYAGSASITWTNVIWSNNINPTLTQVSGYADVFMLTSYKGGAGTPVWIGTVVAAGLVSTNL